MELTVSVSAEQAEALETARRLIRAGVPVFSAAPCPGETCTRPGHSDGTQEYDLPREWQKTVPSEVWLDRWQPGHALAAVGGLACDFLDVDPRNGGEGSEAEMRAAGQWPTVFGVAETPSGGNHYVISPTGERKITGLMPGIDLQSGSPETDGRGHGRGFVWIAPTVRKSKVAPFEPKTYRWLQEPDTDWLQDFAEDSSLEGLRTRIAAYRARGTTGHRGPGDFRTSREFTEEEARDFLRPLVEALETAEIGDIENRCNNLAVALSHFVPDFWTHEFAFDVLRIAVAKTAYDPAHPAARWELGKFHAVIGNTAGRGPTDAWRGVRRPEAVDPATATLDEVDELLAEMLTPGEIMTAEPPKPLIKGYLNLDSESWLIGAPGSKKSFLALDFAAHVAAGMDWHGRKVTRGRVVYVAAEGASGLGKRLTAWQLQHARVLDPGLVTLPRPVQSKDAHAWSVLVRACQRLDPVLIVLDTQARVTVGLEENSATEMGIYVEAVRALREATSACVLSVHHTGRRGGDARGSSAIDGAQHTELTLESVPGSLDAVLRVSKQKDLEELPDYPIRLARHQTGVDEDGEPVTSLAVVEGTGTDGFVTASGVRRHRETEQTVIGEPGSDWIIRAAGESEVRAQLLQVVHDVGQGAGLTMAEGRKHAAARWYGGRQVRTARDGEGLNISTFDRAWKHFVTLAQEVGDVEPVFRSAGGQRWAINEMFIDGRQSGTS